MLGGDFVDFAIQASSYKFRVHMLVLATKSGYFQALLAGGAKWKVNELSDILAAEKALTQGRKVIMLA